MEPASTAAFNCSSNIVAQLGRNEAGSSSSKAMNTDHSLHGTSSMTSLQKLQPIHKTLLLEQISAARRLFNSSNSPMGTHIAGTEPHRLGRDSQMNLSNRHPMASSTHRQGHPSRDSPMESSDQHPVASMTVYSQLSAPVAKTTLASHLAPTTVSKKTVLPNHSSPSLSDPHPVAPKTALSSPKTILTSHLSPTTISKKPILPSSSSPPSSDRHPVTSKTALALSPPSADRHPIASRTTLALSPSSSNLSMAESKATLAKLSRPSNNHPHQEHTGPIAPMDSSDTQSYGQKTPGTNSLLDSRIIDTLLDRLECPGSLKNAQAHNQEDPATKSTMDSPIVGKTFGRQEHTATNLRNSPTNSPIVDTPIEHHTPELPMDSPITDTPLDRLRRILKEGAESVEQPTTPNNRISPPIQSSVGSYAPPPPTNDPTGLYTRAYQEQLGVQVTPIGPMSKRKTLSRPKKRFLAKPTQSAQPASKRQQSRPVHSSPGSQGMDSPASGSESANSLFDGDEGEEFRSGHVASKGPPSGKGRHSSVDRPLARMRGDNVPRTMKVESFEDEDSGPEAQRTPSTPRIQSGYTVPRGNVASASTFAPVRLPNGSRAPYPGYGGYESENGEAERSIYQPGQRTRTRIRVDDEEEYEDRALKRVRYNNNSKFGDNGDDDDEESGNEIFFPRDRPHPRMSENRPRLEQAFQFNSSDWQRRDDSRQPSCRESSHPSGRVEKKNSKPRSGQLFHSNQDLRPSRYSGADMPWGLNQDPPLVDQDEVPDSYLKKRNISRGQGEKVCKRGYGANDPENIAIVNMKEAGMSFKDIADELNEERIKGGRKPTLTVCSVTSRYNRNAPLMFATLGKTFVPMSDRRRGLVNAHGEPTGQITWDKNLDDLLIKCHREFEASRWSRIAQLMEDGTGKPFTEKMVAIRWPQL